MPQYDFRCESCQLRFSVKCRSYGEYDSAALACPDCESADLSRLITDVAISRSGHDYRKMSSGDMLSVLESGDQQQANEMFRQVGGERSSPAGRHARRLRQVKGRVSLDRRSAGYKYQSRRASRTSSMIASQGTSGSR